MENNKTVQVGGGSCSLSIILFVVFLILKLTGVISWSWWLVCLPLIIQVGFIVLLLIDIVIITIIAALAD